MIQVKFWAQSKKTVFSLIHVFFLSLTLVLLHNISNNDFEFILLWASNIFTDSENSVDCQDLSKYQGTKVYWDNFCDIFSLSLTFFFLPLSFFASNSFK